MKNYNNPEWLKEKYKEYGTLAEIARECNISLTTISRKFKKFGIPYKHNTEKGYKTKNAAGYVMVFIGKDYPGSTKWGYVYEHRYVMAQHLGRLLTSDEVVHHINHKKDDNRIENLKLMNRHNHFCEHAQLKSKTLKLKDEVIELRKQNYLVNEICEKTGLSNPTVQRILDELPYICYECDREFNSSKSLGMHITRYHRKGHNKFCQ